MGKRAERPAMSPEAKEQQMIGLAIDCCEQRMRDGTASSAEICHYLKLGTTKARLELEILEHEKQLVIAKTESIRKAEESSALYAEVIKAMKIYKGEEDEEEDYDEDIY